MVQDQKFQHDRKMKARESTKIRGKKEGIRIGGSRVLKGSSDFASMLSAVA